MVCPWILHRDPRWFPEPERFLPERWLGKQAAPRYAYLPFGAGPRQCLGNNFAQVEAILLLATLAPRFRLQAVRPAQPWAAMLLEPEHEPMVRVRPRAA
jgi:cytochrome P450